MQTRRILAILSAAAIAVAIVLYGQTLWGALAYANIKLSPAIPWASPLTTLTPDSAHKRASPLALSSPSLVGLRVPTIVTVVDVGIGSLPLT